MVNAIELFKEICPECITDELKKHFKLDYIIDKQLLCVCQCENCGFVWYLRNKLLD